MYIHSNYDVVAKKQLVGVLPRVGVLHHFTLRISTNFLKPMFRPNYVSSEEPRKYKWLLTMMFVQETNVAMVRPILKPHKQFAVPMARPDRSTSQLAVVVRDTINKTEAQYAAMIKFMEVSSTV